MNARRWPDCIWLLATLLATSVSEAGLGLAEDVGPALVVECPHCSEPVRQRARVMITPGRSRIWTDGWREAHLQSSRPWLLGCPHCRALFWMDEGRPLRRLASLYEHIEWLEAEDALWPEGDDYERILDTASLDENREIYLRKQLWWIANHPSRDLDDLRLSGLDEQQRRNLAALHDLLDSETMEHRTLKAEAARELGNFEAALRLLRDQPDLRGSKLANLIETLAEQRVSAVRELR